MVICRSIGMVLAVLALVAGYPASLLGSSCQTHEMRCQPLHKPEAEGEVSDCCCALAAHRRARGGDIEAGHATAEPAPDGCHHECSFDDEGQALLFVAPGASRPPAPDSNDLFDSFERFSDSRAAAGRPIRDGASWRSPPPPPLHTALALLQVRLT